MGIYNGNSEGVKSIINSFEDYAKYVALSRAFPSVYDGLKHVHRRAIYALHKEKTKDLLKSVKAVGLVMAFHPHGDSSIYEAMQGMTDVNGTIKPSPLKGYGNLGKPYSSDEASSMRYTSMGLSKLARELFLEDMEGVTWVETETDTGDEPKELPVKFPMALTASMQGIGVGLANKIPSFNFNEVLDLTISYIESGEQFNSQIIYPDFPNGGIVLANNKEMAKLMTTGVASVISRAKIEVDKKDIYVLEFPHNTTDGAIVKKIKALIRNHKDKDSKDYGKFPYITHEDKVIVTSELKGSGIKITCRKASDTTHVINELMRRGILQNKMKTNMIFSDGDKLIPCGAYGVVTSWLQDRKAKLTLKFNKNLASYEEEKIVLDYFLQLVNDTPKKETYLKLLTQESVYDAKSFLEENYKGIPEHVVSWIASRRASAFLDGGKYLSRYNSLVDSIKAVQSYLNDLNSYIVSELKTIKATYGSDYKRLTEISNIDYKFVKREEVVEEDESYATYTIFSNGVMVKGKSAEEYENNPHVIANIEGFGNSVLVGFDYVGNLIRIYGNDFDYGKHDLHKYLGMSGITPDYHLKYLTLLDGSTKVLLYRDGKTSLFDTSEFLDKKTKKPFVRTGVPRDVDDMLVEVVDERDLKEYVYVADETKALHIGLFRWSDIARKARTAKSRAVTGKSSMNITQWGTCDEHELPKYFTSYEDFLGKLKKVANGDIKFDGTEFEEGRYLSEA